MYVYLKSILLFGIVACGFTHASQTKIPVQDLKSDFEALYQNLKEAHFDLYVNITKADLDREYKIRMNKITKPMTPIQAQIYFQKFVALIKIAHTKIDLPNQAFADFMEGGGAVFPLDIRVKEKKFFIIANDSGIKDIQAGDQLISINGETMEQWSRRLAAYISADTDTMLHGFFEFWFPFLVWLEMGEQSHFKVTVTRAAANPQTYEIPARDRSFMQDQSKMRKGRLSLDGGRSFRIMDGIGYLRPGPFYNIDGEDIWDVKPFQKFIDNAYSKMIDQSVKALIIDIRDNPGGTNSFSDHMLAWFADKPFRFASRFDVKVSKQTIKANAKRLKPNDTESISAQYAKEFATRKPGDIFPFHIEEATPRKGQRFQKPVYLLVNRHSYSNAVLVATMVQDYGFGTVIGEETNDLATTYGAMEHFNLPKTQIQVGYPKAFIIRPNGDATIRGVVPDIIIETPLIETEDDPVLKETLKVLKERLK